MAERADVDYSGDFNNLTPLAAALAYAGMGWRIFPSFSKHPLIKKYSIRATADPTQLEEWWKYWPSADPALAVHHPIVVVDLDVRDGARGPEVFAALVGADPLTYPIPIAQSASGGLHLYFVTEAPLKNWAGQIGPGVDTRVNGGLVVLPTSDNGRRWLKPPTLPPIELPRAIVEAALAKVDLPLPPAPTAEYQGFITPDAFRAVKAAVKAIKDAPNGEQEATLNRKAFALGGLVGAGELPFEPIYALLVKAGEQMVDYRPSQPWTYAQIENKVHAAMLAGMDRPWFSMETLEKRILAATEAFVKEYSHG
jgi:hypothetical protein